ncbi:MAG: TIGR02556 family CRISPR-associated protein [Sedimentibacter sp.]|uniref:TIGR02556 family CRISPR-associated protein n=1 Tax=Sedimentibacter sp. TaxID=1960295 RepID=UPI0029811D22|nr:TIGR02556 family CRISPR-associated protein [Sedimentibacter sp.]MDW5298887.1 TIGR02556 family CRISPR-associated protein [Sedimentibacter sp.]
MLYDVYRVGKAICKTNNSDDKLLVPETPRNITNVISLCFKRRGEEVIYTGIDITDYNVDMAHKYLLRTGSSRGTNHGPSAQLTEVDKTLKIKIAAWFKDLQSEKSDENDQNLISQIYQLISDNQKKMEDYINENMPKGKGIKNLLTVKVDGKFPADVELFYQCYSDKIRRKLIGEDNHKGTCCLCGKKSVYLLPKVDVFKFYTLDKPGFISGGFQKEDIWRNCPVCISCEPILREGKKYMLENLGFNFYGLRYYLIPSSTFNQDLQGILVDLLENISAKSFSFKEGAAKEIDSLSDDIFDELAEYRDVNSFRIIFFFKKQSAERILLDIKDIFPSRFRELYSAKYKIEEIYNSIIDEKFNFSYFREFLSKSDNKMNKNDLDNNFLSLTKDIFTGEKLSIETLLPHYMRNIRHAFLNDEKFYATTLHAWIGVNYLYEIGCMDYRRENFMEGNLKEMLSPYSAGLDTDVKRALVLTGVLVRKVMNIQAKELNGSTHFTSKLKGLKMRQSDVQGLISETVNKMNEYNSYSKASREIVTAISEFIFKSPTDWKLSIDEINFYIVGGMSLSKKIYDGLNVKPNEEEE